MRILIFIAFFALLLNCTGSIARNSPVERRNLVTGPLELPSGNQIIISNISKMEFQKSGPGLVMYYKTPIPIENTVDLRKEVNEIWTLFQKDAEAESVSGAVIRAFHDENQGSVQKGKGYGFVFIKNDDGTWH